MAADSTTSPGNVRSVSAHGFSWIAVERPTHGETDALIREHDLLPADLDRALDRRERPGIWQRSHYLLILTQVPVAPPGNRRRVSETRALAVFVRPDRLVSIQSEEIRPLARLFEHVESDPVARDAAFATGVGGVLLAIFERLIGSVDAARLKLAHEISLAEDTAVRDSGWDALEQLAPLRRDALSLRRLARALETATRTLGGIDLGLATANDWEQLALRSSQLADELTEDLDSLRGIRLALDSATRLRQRASLRALTVAVATALPVIAIVVVLALLPTNPLTRQPGIFTIYLGIVGVVLLGALALLKRQRIV